MSLPTSKTTLVVGIDFGTTYSGVSWLVCKTGTLPGQPEVVSMWPTSTDNRKHNSDSHKVPSKMHCDGSGNFSWGFRIPAGAETIEWFKLLLLNNEDLQKHLQGCSHLRDAKRSLLKVGKTAVQLIGEYLKVLWNHVLEQICNAKGQAVIDGMPFQVVLTVPAIWTDYARDRMREAARIAGILKYRVAGDTILSFVSEPEAAAIATFPELENRPDLQVGDSFVVVDAGGGTVDIISYKINKLDPFSVSECVEGEGALCGGTFLDKEFEALLKRSIGIASWNKMNGSDIRRMMNNEWEHGIKQAFSGDPDYFTVELPSRAQSDAVQFSTDELQPIFDKIISQIGVLVKNQIGAVKAKTLRLPKLVILVGGFGRSLYILKYLRAKLDTGVAVLQARGDKPWTAICRGAALFGAGSNSASGGRPAQVQSRISRMNYGLVYAAAFKEGIHDPRDKFWHNVKQEWCADNQMQWFIKRGDDVSLVKTKGYECSRSWGLNEQGWGIFTDSVCACADWNPPSRKEGNVREVAKYTYKTGKTKEKYQRVFNNDTAYRKWTYAVKVTVSGASFEATIVSDGREQKMEKILVEAS